ncbi:hypothetical protein PbDSM24746_33930 [Paenibacillus macerans]|nr:hypothetical protein PbDSM24746_33930 [Paenibacillus macerans]GIP07871.1 hypothetical protein J1TS5_00410 [Paenibacillus macerans]
MINKTIKARMPAKPTLNVVGTARDENTGETTKKAVIRQKISKKTENPCNKVSIIYTA